MDPQPRFRLTGQLVIGVALAILGVLFTLDNLHVLRARDYLPFWPVVLLAIGLVHVVQARTAAGVMGGVIWLVIGSALLGDRLGFIHFNIWSYWPLLLVLIGGRIVLQAMSPDAPRRDGGLVAMAGGRSTWRVGGDPSELVSAVAIMGGFDRRVTSHEFRGGELTAFMGGGKLDLRDAMPKDGVAVVTVFALMGGFEILIPETWSVTSEVTPFMGSVEDHARTSSSPSAPRLIVRGFVMMSGVEIKNS
jgi:predicted membrane protein